VRPSRAEAAGSAKTGVAARAAAWELPPAARGAEARGEGGHADLFERRRGGLRERRERVFGADASEVGGGDGGVLVGEGGKDEVDVLADRRGAEQGAAQGEIGARERLGEGLVGGFAGGPREQGRGPIARFRRLETVGHRGRVGRGTNGEQGAEDGFVAVLEGFDMDKAFAAPKDEDAAGFGRLGRLSC